MRARLTHPAAGFPHPLDRDSECVPVPVGVEGELVSASEQLAHWLRTDDGVYVVVVRGDYVEAE